MAAEPDPRPRPQYGELAPEGWSWSPEQAGGDPAGGSGGAAGGPSGSNGPSGSPTPSSGSPAPGAGPVPGVPHNLGVTGGGRSAGTAQPTGTARPGARDPEPYRAAAPPQAQQPQAASAPQASAAASQARTGGRTADRVITIALLALGAFGALYFAASLQQLPASLSMIGSALEIEGFTVPEGVGTLGVVGALAVLAVYALNLIYSIQRMRTRRLAFWVPLAAAVIAFVITFAFTAFALNQAPELMRALTDPESTAKIFAYLGRQAG